MFAALLFTEASSGIPLCRNYRRHQPVEKGFRFHQK